LVNFKKCSTSDAKKVRRCEKQVIKTVQPRDLKTGKIIKRPTKKQKKSAAIAICTTSIQCSIRAK